ncbi:MAG: glutamate--tRNA ligase, partial [candidate division KSB1 bacterium]|nr:glutamate--tRNA ligase [candidate division KSB1 bacterium]
WDEEALEKRRSYLEKVVELLKLRARKLSDFPRVGRYFFFDPEGFEAQGVRKHFADPEVVSRLERLAEVLEGCEPFEAGRVEACLRSLAEELGIKAAQLIHPARLAVTGRTGGPGLFELFAVLGREVVVRRLRRAAELIRTRQVQEVEVVE